MLTVYGFPNSRSLRAVWALEEAERRHILTVLERCQGNKTHAAQRLGITRLPLRNKLKQYGLAEEGDEGDAL